MDEGKEVQTVLGRPIPTHTFVLDLGRYCNLEGCKFCYYKHLGDLRKQGWKEKYALLTEIDQGIARGNTRTEFTGGEPSLYPRVEELIQYLKNRNIKVCMITNGLISEKKLQSIIDAGVDEFLLSVHGTRDTHDTLTRCMGAHALQGKTLEHLVKSNLPDGFRFNCVINKYNQHEIIAVAAYVSWWKPTIANFINMNPHHSWANDEKGTKEVIADLRVVEPLLNQAIELLEDQNIGVNVRYYPMCRIDEKYRKCICNDNMVMFDDKEWDYAVSPKTYEKHRQWGINTSNNVEEKGEPCCRCDLQWICGGANKHFHRVSNQIYGEVLKPQTLPGIDKNDFMYYRKSNPVGVKYAD